MTQIGDKVTFADGYHFYVTLHGPMVMGTCIDCGEGALEVGYTERVNRWGLKEDTGGGVPTRCTGCARRAHGLD